MARGGAAGESSSKVDNIPVAKVSQLQFIDLVLLLTDLQLERTNLY